MRLLLIEDSSRLQESLKAGLTRAGYAMDIAGDGERGLMLARQGHYDLIVLDLMLPRLDGLEILQRLRSDGLGTPVLILTARQSVEDRVRGLQLGADDYLPKPFAFEELLARIQALVRRGYGSREPSIAVGEWIIDTVGRRVLRGGESISLTGREYRILELLARRQGETLTRNEIEDHVYGEEDLPSSNAVDSAICTLRRKLGDPGSGPGCLIQTRKGLGYRLCGAGE